MRFCTKCGSPVSGMLRFCTRCGAATSSAAGRKGGGVAATARSRLARSRLARSRRLRRVRTARAPPIPPRPSEFPGREPCPLRLRSARSSPAHPGSLPVIPAQAGVADAESGGVPPDDSVPAEAAAPEPDQPESAEAPPAALATDQPELALEYSPAPPATALPTGMSEDAGPLGLVQIGAEPDHEAWPEDPWLPGSRRPDRRALIIGVVLIAGLLSVASTAWLVRVNPPQASSPHGTHRSRPSRLGSGHAQPSQALSGQPTPILIQPSQPAAQPTPAQPACAHPDSGPGADRPPRHNSSLDTTPARTQPEQQRPPGNQPERDGAQPPWSAGC